MLQDVSFSADTTTTRRYQTTMGRGNENRTLKRQRPVTMTTMCAIILTWMACTTLSTTHDSSPAGWVVMAFQGLIRKGLTTYPSRSHKSRSTILQEKQQPQLKRERTKLQLLMVEDSTLKASDSAQKEREYEMHVGHALDTLRNDYAVLLTESPDYTIYDKHLEIIDHSGVMMNGIQSYKNAISFAHTIVKVFYCPARSKMQFRMCYDKARRNIRIHWNAAVVPREIFGGVRTTAHLDGISVYEIDRESGLITQHRIETILMNDMPLQGQEDIYAALAKEHGISVPSFAKQVASFAKEYTAEEDEEQGLGPAVPLVNHIIQFKPPNPLLLGQRSTSLFAWDASSDQFEDKSSYPGLDWDAFDTKNKSRKKWGLKPLTPDEFLELDQQVKSLETQQKQKQASAVAAAKMSKDNEGRQKFVDRLFGNIMKDTCESNYDCQRPEVCCDFGFKKQCCSSGMFVGKSAYSREGQLAMVPVPVSNKDKPNQYPPNNDLPRHY